MAWDVMSGKLARRRFSVYCNDSFSYDGNQIARTKDLIYRADAEVFEMANSKKAKWTYNS